MTAVLTPAGCSCAARGEIERQPTGADIAQHAHRLVVAVLDDPDHAARLTTLAAQTPACDVVGEPAQQLIGRLDIAVG